MDGFYIIDLPIYPKRVKEPRGNGGKNNKGIARHNIPSNNSKSVMYGTGCLRHACDNCENCPEPDCDYSIEMENKLRKSRIKQEGLDERR